MKKLLFLLIPLTFLFLGCPHDCARIDEYGGRYISNFPEWIRSSELTQASGIWKKWNSEDAKKLYSYMPPELDFSNFDGYYRLVFNGQNVIVLFDDKELTSLNLFYVFVAKAKEFNDTIFIPQDNENIFKFSGFLKLQGDEDLSTCKKAEVQFRCL